MAIVQDERRIERVCLMILAGAAVAAALYYLSAVLVPFVLALFFTFVLTPLAHVQMRWLRLPRGVAIVSTLVIAVLILALVAVVVSLSAGQLAGSLPAYQDRLEALAQRVMEKLPHGDEEEIAPPRPIVTPSHPEIVRPAPLRAAPAATPPPHVQPAPVVDAGPATRPAAPTTTAAAPTTSAPTTSAPTTTAAASQPGEDEGEGMRTEALKDVSKGAQRIFQVSTATMYNLMVGLASSLLALLSQGLLVLIFVLFMLLGAAARPRPTSGLWAEVEWRVRRYVAIKVAVSAITGLLVGIVLALLGVDLALSFGLLTFLLNFIPNIGSVVATLLPLPIVLLAPDASPVVIVLAIAIPGTIQFVIGNIIEPRVMGESLDLHPITVLAALILWGMIWGMVGMFIAAPLTAVAKILFEKLDATRPIAAILAGRFDWADEPPKEQS